MILVSVIIPYLKKKNFIKKTLNSLKKQTYKNLEIIIIYDDENLSDLKFIKKFKKLDKRIKIIVNKKSQGAGRSRNIGMNIAKGKFIAFLDADDLWKKNKIELQLEYMVRNKFEISHTNYEILKVNKKDKKVMRARMIDNYKNLLFSCDIGLSTVMLKKKLISKNCQFPNLKTKEDFVLWLMILKKNIKIGGLDRNLTTWRKLNDSLSASIFQKLKDGFTLYNKFMKFNIFKSLLYLFILSINSIKKK